MEDDPSCEPAAVAAAEPPTTVEDVASAIDRMRQTIREQVDVLTLKQAGSLLIRSFAVLNDSLLTKPLGRLGVRWRQSWGCLS